MKNFMKLDTINKNSKFFSYEIYDFHLIVQLKMRLPRKNFYEMKNNVSKYLILYLGAFQFIKLYNFLFVQRILISILIIQYNNNNFLVL